MGTPLYTVKYPDKLAGVWQSKQDALKETPLFKLVDGLSPNLGGGGGGCLSFTLPSGNLLGMYVGGDISPPCELWTAIAAIMNITALFWARRIIFGG